MCVILLLSNNKHLDGERNCPKLHHVMIDESGLERPPGA